MINLTKGLYPFWDDFLIDTRRSDAELSLNHPERRGTVMVFDKPWEGNGTCFFSIFKDSDEKGDFFRMYYETWSFKIEGTYNKDLKNIRVCCAESRDGVNWVRPDLGICEFGGNKNNNIIIDSIPDNFSVVIDKNPDCPPEEKYKALMLSTVSFEPDVLRELWLLVSGDGLHFTKRSTVSSTYNCDFDTLNTLHWDPVTKKYYCYIRSNYDIDENNDPRFDETYIRAIKVLESPDCVNWTEPVFADFNGGGNYPLYTNSVMPYPFDGRYQVGFPKRYVQRKEWNDNYEQLTGKELRLERMKKHPRLGLAVDDCVFMSSRDHYSWYRFDEAFLTSGPENGDNWIYGDCTAHTGELIVLPSPFGNEPDEINLYFFQGHWTAGPTKLLRYAIRRDGFASVKAPYEKKTLRTKPFTFEGGSLSLNFATSARGGITLKVLDGLGHPIPGYESCELFGNTICRHVNFSKPLSELAGRPVIFEFSMRDAEIFSMTFSD
ncbi:MAG: hypothetical protein IJV00_02440 [Clostridia bacterium]|nr:hypothetical protein [Clostridia bacterium]